MEGPGKFAEIDVTALLEALEEGLLQLEEGRVCAANAALVRMSGRSRRELLRCSLGELLCGVDGAPLQLLESTDAARLRDATGRLVPISLRLVDARTALVTDRSRERRLEHEVWRMSGGAAPDAVLASELAGLIEHELGTASTLVRGNLRMVLDERAGTLSGDQRSFLLEARRGSDRIGRLAADLLELCAGERSDPHPMVRKPWRLTPLIEQVVRETHPLLDERGARLEMDIELDCDELLLDGPRIEQVLHNLIANAAKFGPAGGVVRVAAHEFEEDEGARVCVSVIDEGPGVSAADAEAIFAPFARGESALASKAGGIGLGLAVCRAIALAHGGRVEALAELGHGHFRLVLPRAGCGAGA